MQTLTCRGIEASPLPLESNQTKRPPACDRVCTRRTACHEKDAQAVKNISSALTVAAAGHICAWERSWKPEAVGAVLEEGLLPLDDVDLLMKCMRSAFGGADE